MKKSVAAVACAFIATFPGTPLRAETAVSIDCSFVDRPAQLPATFAAPAGANLRFIALKAIDGEAIDGALWQPASKTAADTTLVIGVPGSGGNFARAPISPLSSALAAIPDIKYVLLPNAKGPNPGGHFFSDTAQALADATAAWLGELGL